jgi:hypothetical protein
VLDVVAEVVTGLLEVLDFPAGRQISVPLLAYRTAKVRRLDSGRLVRISGACAGSRAQHSQALRRECDRRDRAGPAPWGVNREATACAGSAACGCDRPTASVTELLSWGGMLGWSDRDNLVGRDVMLGEPNVQLSHRVLLLFCGLMRVCEGWACSPSSYGDSMRSRRWLIAIGAGAQPITRKAWRSLRPCCIIWRTTSRRDGALTTCFATPRV